LQRLRRKVAFDRLPAWLFQAAQPRAQPWVLKGGYAMELRIKAAHTTKDIDLPSEGIRLDVTVKAPDIPQFTVTDQSDGLPEVPGLSRKPRSGNRMSLPQVWPFFDATTLVSRTFPIESQSIP
jgi:hypothetical protein